MSGMKNEYSLLSISLMLQMQLLAIQYLTLKTINRAKKLHCMLALSRKRLYEIKPWRCLRRKRQWPVKPGQTETWWENMEDGYCSESDWKKILERLSMNSTFTWNS